MIKIKKSTEKEISGFTMVLLYILSLTCTYSTHKGDHINIAIGLFCFETSIGFSLWRKLLP